jgi:hypothetical protein
MGMDLIADKKIYGGFVLIVTLKPKHIVAIKNSKDR